MPPKKTNRKKNKKNYKKKNKIPKSFGSPVTIIRHRYIGSIIADATVPLYGAYAFTLADLPSYTEFTALYDEYKIWKVVLSFIPGRATQAFGTSQYFGQFIYVVDHDDADVPTATTTLFQYPACKIKSVTKPITVTIIPKIASTVYRTGITSAYSAKRQYLDCVYADVPHYGFKYQISPSGTAGIVEYNVYAKYYVSLKGVR